MYLVVDITHEFENKIFCLTLSNNITSDCADATL